jgi:hypothetical protein
VIGFAQKGVLKVDQFALHVDRDDLPVPVGDDLMPDCETPQEHTRIFGFVELAHDVVALLDGFDGVRKRENRTPVLGIQIAPVSEFAD